MKIVYLIGGFGNQCFQLSYAGSNSCYSTVLLSKFFRNKLSHTIHEDIFARRTKWWHYLLLIVVFTDYVIAKITNRCFFTKFDLNSLRSNPYFPCVFIGYFQEESSYSELPKAALSTIPSHFTHKDTVVLHVRGGDILSLSDEKNPNGVLHKKYYASAIQHIVGQDSNVLCIDIQTNDELYGQEMLTYLDGVFPDLVFGVSESNLSDMISKSVSSNWFVGSNSTLSFWIMVMREGYNCFLPDPVLKKKKISSNLRYHSIRGFIK